MEKLFAINVILVILINCCTSNVYYKDNPFLQKLDTNGHAMYPDNPFLKHTIPVIPSVNPGMERFANNPFINNFKPTKFDNAIKDVCGYSVYHLIIGGEKVRESEYPWLGGLFNKDKRYICTVNLVSRKHVITAAHCIDGYENPDEFSVILGKTKPSTDDGYLPISDIEVHPDYEETAAHDVAILTLRDEIVFTHKKKPICIWNAGLHASQATGMVAGFGYDYTDFRKVQYPIVTQDECRGSHKHFRQLISEKTFCAGRKNGEGPCLGDSGSGFMQWVGRYYLRGVVSQSLNDNNNCNLQQFIIFADLATETNWLQEQLKEIY